MIKRWLCCALLFVVLVGAYALTDRVQAAATMTSSDALVNYIKTMEGFRAYPYYDYGQHSVGYGTKCPDDKYNYYCQNGITEAEAVALLKKELNTAETALNSFASKHNLTWKQHQFDALVSFTFNVGTGWLSETDGNMYGAVIAGDTGNRFIYSIGLWSTAGGQFVLLERRMSEANLYINGKYEPYNASSTPFPSSYRWVFLDGGEATVRYRVFCYDSNLAADLSGVTFKETPSGKTLTGWYTASGTKVTKLDSSRVTGETLYARWGTGSGSSDTIVSPTPQLGITLTVTNSDVRIRSGPGLSYSHVGWNTKGDKITVTEIKTADGYTWGKFAKGWSALNYTNFSSSAGWVQEGTYRVYYKNGSKLKNQWMSDGVGQCWLNGSGYAVASQWVTVSGKSYYLDSAGHKVIGKWVNDGTGYAWVGSDGVRLYNQWFQNGNNLYYINSSGYRVVGSITLNGHTYRFDGNGVLLDWYTVKFLNWDGTVISTGTYKCGDTVTVPPEPAREADQWYSYTFAGWTPQVTTCCGNAEYTATYTATETTVPAIVNQPQAVTAKSGEVAQFTVETQGHVAAYRWEYRTIYKWFSTTMDGFDTPTLNVAVTGARHGYDYRCVITFHNGTELITEPAELLVECTTQIIQAPRDQAVCLGDKGQFTVTATGEGLKYQWQYKRPDGTKWIDTAMEGATKPTVMIETTTARNGYQYRCKITDATGTVVYSEPATMSVLSFVKHPASVTAKAGTTVQLTVTTSLSEGFTYQWQYSRNGGATWSNTTMGGCNTDTLTVSVTAARNGYQYRCVLTGSKSSKVISKAATLTVN